MVIVVNKLIN